MIKILKGKIDYDVKMTPLFTLRRKNISYVGKKKESIFSHSFIFNILSFFRRSFFFLLLLS